LINNNSRLIKIRFDWSSKIPLSTYPFYLNRHHSYFLKPIACQVNVWSTSHLVLPKIRAVKPNLCYCEDRVYLKDSKKYPNTRIRTRDRPITAILYSRTLCQLSYVRKVTILLIFLLLSLAVIYLVWKDAKARTYTKRHLFFQTLFIFISPFKFQISIRIKLNYFI
jgi:hypothetical protein